MAVLCDPRITSPAHLKVLRDAAHSHSLELAVDEAATPGDIAPAIDAASKAGAQAMNVLASSLFSFNSRQVVDRSAALRLPAIYQWPAEDGGFWLTARALHECIGKWRVSSSS